MKLVRLAISAEHIGMTRLPNPVTTRMSHKRTNLRNINKSHILFELDYTFICKTYYLHLAKYTH